MHEFKSNLFIVTAHLLYWSLTSLSTLPLCSCYNSFSLKTILMWSPQGHVLILYFTLLAFIIMALKISTCSLPVSASVILKIPWNWNIPNSMSTFQPPCSLASLAFYYSFLFWTPAIFTASLILFSFNLCSLLTASSPSSFFSIPTVRNLIQDLIIFYLLFQNYSTYFSSSLLNFQSIFLPAASSCSFVATLIFLLKIFTQHSLSLLKSWNGH